MSVIFAHYEAYGRKASGNRGRGGRKIARSISDVLAEAGRRPGFCPHVQSPQAPETLFGRGLAAVEERILEVTTSAVDSRGRALRCDALVMLAPVFSWPVETSGALDGDVQEALLREWQTLVVQFCRDTWGTHLVTIVEHLDESHPHLHAYVVAPRRPDGTVRIADIDPAVAAAEAVKRAGGDCKAQQKAHCDAKREFQDAYHAKVGEPFGHQRKGPGRKRLSPREYAEEKRRVEVRARAIIIEEQAKARGMASALAEVDQILVRKAAEMREQADAMVAQAQAAAQERVLRVLDDAEQTIAEERNEAHRAYVDAWQARSALQVVTREPDEHSTQLAWVAQALAQRGETIYDLIKRARELKFEGNDDNTNSKTRW